MMWLKWLILIPPLLVFYFSLRTLINILRFREASLGLFLSKLKESTSMIGLLALSMLLFSITRIMDIIDMVIDLPMNDTIIAALIWSVSIILAMVFYRMSRITSPD
ncbi:MAG: hypothetical protein GX212_06670 [Methanothermobacter wolfeii]|nr:hypothetical protein [Methanothermobacter wolfeii]NLM03026.1 hypothetical protein [Methanothermobacter wolfeii]